MSEWPQHEHRTVPWQSTGRHGPREDRVFSEVVVSLPPRLGDVTVPSTPPRDLLRARYETEEARADRR
ncbi:hypothetical protein [Clavibacter tessellarius]|uniref:hypothetical protein n=1 Tax=Clavibacter tessellarius TaxID=31965 RepID=UPI00324EB154